MKHVEKPMEHEGEAGAYGDLTFFYLPIFMV